MPSQATISAIRFGYGPGGRDVPADAATHLERLSRPDTLPARFKTTTMDEAIELGARFRKARQKRDTTGIEQDFRAARRELTLSFGGTAIAALARIAETDDPLRERLVWFWVDHFATAPKNQFMRALAASYVDDAIRPYVAGRFADMLKAAVTHPMMLLYLDQVQSAGPNSSLGKRRGIGLNENLAREVLELHTLGVVATYSQDDVRELAELFTGLSATQTDGFKFRPAMAEPGEETVLGQIYGGGRPVLDDIHAVLEDLAVHPATANHVSRKLAVHFVSDDPDPDLVAAMADAWLRHDGNLLFVMEALLSHPAAWADRFPKARQPFDFIATALVASGIEGREVASAREREVRSGILQPLRVMGQPFMEPAGPDGWAEAADHWITPLGLANRILWSGEAAKRIEAGGVAPTAFLRRALGDAASDELAWAVSAAETRADGVALVLSSPEFNRR